MYSCFVWWFLQFMKSHFHSCSCLQHIDTVILAASSASSPLKLMLKFQSGNWLTQVNFGKCQMNVCVSQSITLMLRWQLVDTAVESCMHVCLCVESGAGLTQPTSETMDDSDQDQPHSGSQSLSQKVCFTYSHFSFTSLQLHIAALRRLSSYSCNLVVWCHC